MKLYKLTENNLTLKNMIASEVYKTIQERKRQNKKTSDKNYLERLKDNQKSFGLIK